MKERLVICNEEDTDGRDRVTTDDILLQWHSESISICTTANDRYVSRRSHSMPSFPNLSAKCNNHTHHLHQSRNQLN